MIDELALMTAVASIGAAIAGAGASTEIARRLFKRKQPDVESLRADLAQSRVDRWNEFRSLSSRAVPSLKNIDLSNRDLSGVDFSDCDLEGANFSFSDLQRSNFARANLTGANFVGADISLSSFVGASLKNAELKVHAGQSVDLEDAEIDFDPVKLLPPSEDRPLERLITSLPKRETLRAQSAYISEFISELHGYEFENFVSELMLEFGFDRLQREMQSSDFPDLFVSRDDPFFTVSLLVEMKTFRSGRKVGTEAIHQVIRYLNSFSNKATGAVIVTNTGFSSAAQSLADESPLISLVDNRTLTLAVDQFLALYAKYNVALYIT